MVKIILIFLGLVFIAIVLPVLGPTSSRADSTVSVSCDSDRPTTCGGDLLYHRFSGYDECKRIEDDLRAGSNTAAVQLVGTKDACGVTATCQFGITHCDITGENGGSCSMQTAIPDCSVAQFDTMQHGSWGGPVVTNCGGCNPPPPVKHKTCQNNACILVDGAGNDSCQSNNDCAPQTHLECRDMACTTVAGAGNNSCSTNSDCFHFTCQNNACTQVAGGGQNSCSQNSDCVPATHNECRNNACTQVNGAGQNTCNTNADCTPQTHKECRNNACVTVSGAGTSTCSSDSQCQPVSQRAICDSLSVSQNSGTAPLYVNSTLSGHTENGGSIVSYKFNFGDGSGDVSQSGNSLGHTFNNVGTYVISGIVTDNLGNQAGGTACQKVVTAGAVLGTSTTTPIIPKTGPETAILVSLFGSGALGWVLKKFKLGS